MQFNIAIESDNVTIKHIDHSTIFCVKGNIAVHRNQFSSVYQIAIRIAQRNVAAGKDYIAVAANAFLSL